ncbi:MAG: hypothetical protein MUO41_13440, partial [Methyloceanibacter sp.]|nr:hypothetical protein [Methyloceanibacter sp.]
MRRGSSLSAPFLRRASKSDVTARERALDSGYTLSFGARCVLLFIGVALAFAVVAPVDALFFDQPLLVERPPQGGLYFALRTALACMMARLVVGEVYRNRSEASAFETVRRGSVPGILTASIVVILALASAALLRLDPVQFSQLAVEDSVFEWASAAALFGGSLLLLATVIKLARQPHGHRRGIFPALLLSGLLFLIAMEEISWFQRVFDLHTPVWLMEINHQDEMNLHNIVTDQVENAYYFGAFIFLVLLPFVADAAPRWRLVERFANFVPGRFVVVVGAVATAFCYAMWNILWIQFSVFASVFILIAYAAAAVRGERRGEAAMFIGAAIALAV